MALGTVLPLRAEFIGGPITNNANGHFYYILTPKTWTESEAQAVALGGHLVTIDDDTENSWVQTTLGFYSGVQRRLWIGLTDQAQEGQFVWASGSASTYRNWLAGEPNNGNGGNEDFVFMYRTNEGRGPTWNDVPDTGDGLVYGVVEVEPSPANLAVLAGPITNSASGHFYYLLSPGTWSQSESFARSLGGHLVTIDDAEENTWVRATFSSLGGVQRRLWLGLTDRAQEGQFVWSSGSPSTYRNWLAGEPNNSGGNEDFVFMYSPNEGRGATWNDVADVGDGVIYAVVEIDPFRAEIRVSEVEVCWFAAEGNRYQVQYSTQASPSVWKNLGEPVPGTGTRQCVQDPVAVGAAQRFYQVISLP